MSAMCKSAISHQVRLFFNTTTQTIGFTQARIQKKLLRISRDLMALTL